MSPASSVPRRAAAIARRAVKGQDHVRPPRLNTIFVVFRSPIFLPSSARDIWWFRPRVRLPDPYRCFTN
ncbi:hypothetical protein PVAP13_9KG254613 [Panicum virgatum]|uniref:Uncharacterized protein n=1 Tax=Panicum virgatum TaxID=38727 RepID=A0A8T0NNE8_PANVG|nr:hypothetical protein PVAP13_9KG254613 [Panicum virgatum]